MMTKVQDQNRTPATTGLVLHGAARYYDLHGLASDARSGAGLSGEGDRPGAP